MNPQVILPDGDSFELDILFMIDSDVYWFEAKTGNYIEKLSVLRT
jgi:hypothetical protein